MTTYYSQHGEDFLLDQIFKRKQQGFFVEVGCIDGRRFSNTLVFEEKGWNGMCVEAHSGYIEFLKRNRPNSIICHYAAGERDEDGVIFYTNSRGSLSSLDKSKEKYFREKYGRYFTGFKEQRISKRRLDTLFKRYGIKEIDIVSLDVEGYEPWVLMGIDFQQYKPLVFVIESENFEHERWLDNILIPVGYIKSVRIASNIFYLANIELRKKIENKVFNITLTHTPHPLDGGENALLKTIINTHSYSRNVLFG